MEGLLVLLLVVLLLVGWVLLAVLVNGQSVARDRIRRLEGQLQGLTQELAMLTHELHSLERWVGKAGRGRPRPAPTSPVQRQAAGPHTPGGLRPPPPPARPPSPSLPLPPEPLPPEPLPTQPQPPPRQPRPVAVAPSRQALPWRRLERLLIENWTGILGVVVVVAGITFLAINLALRMGPFPRFLLVVAAAAALCLPSLLVGRREPWRNLGDWMRSGGAALFLFACAAAGGFPGLGLQWLHRPLPALALLLVGIAANLALAAAARTQAVASLHVVVNLVPLLIVPPSAASLAIASSVALVGLALPGRRPWERHLLLVSWAYALFHGSWFLRLSSVLPSETGLRTVAIGAAVLVFGAGVVRAQRRAAPGSREAPAGLRGAELPLALGLSNWGALGLALLVHPRLAAVRAAALALAAAAALLLARRARSTGVPWLHLANTLVAQAFVMAAILSLQSLIADGLLLSALLLLETLGFLWLGVAEDHERIRSVGWVLVSLAAAAVGLSALATVGPGWAGRAGPLQNASLVIGAGGLLGLVQHGIGRRRISVPLPPLLGWMAAGLVFVGAMVCTPESNREWVALPAMGGLLLLARWGRPAGLLEGLTVAVLATHLLSWGALLAQQPWKPLPLLAHLLPLAALALVLIGTGSRRGGRLVGMDLLGLGAGLGAYLLFEPVSPLLPGVAWLLLSLLALEAADRLRRQQALHALALGLLHLAAFAAAYLLVISQSPSLVTLGAFTLSARLLVQLFGLAVVLYWWFFRPRQLLAQQPLWQAIHPWFLEAALAGATVTLLSEITTLWRPVGWSLLALALLSPPVERLFAVRVKVYAVIFYWIAVAMLVGMLSTFETPSPRWFEQPQQVALLAIGLQVLYVLVSHRLLDPVALRDPGGIPLLGWIGTAVASHRNRWLCYPLFAAVALYLATRYDHSLLTLLWTVEAFVIYLLSAILRENQFRTVALIALGACLLRLVAIDMAQADLGLRGAVFVGVGLLMLAMNAIYSRFRGRFE